MGGIGLSFTSFTYVGFFAVVAAIYWATRTTRLQNLFLLCCSYIFYGWIHPWFCLLIASSTVVDFFCGKIIHSRKDLRVTGLVLSLVFNLGLLGVYKYFDFFVSSFEAAFRSLGFSLNLPLLEVLLPVGISFYTFQTLSYTIDIYRKRLQPTDRFVDFALFVGFFPQLVAGPIERAARLLPQIQTKRRWHWRYLPEAGQLLLAGYVKKLVIADNLAPLVDKVFLMQQPSGYLILAGTVAFAVQILADFSAYTDIARGSAKLLGFDLMQNFDAPYLAVSPSDFWRRWHISFSSWIRDYLYIPLGGSKAQTNMGFFLVLVTTMGLSGLWHGARWNFFWWGIFHAGLVFTYHRLGMGGRWQPASLPSKAFATCTMFALTVVGWGIFRTHDMGWLISASVDWSYSLKEWTGTFEILTYTLLASSIFLPIGPSVKKLQLTFTKALIACFMFVLIYFFGRSGHDDFIYFRF